MMQRLLMLGYLRQYRRYIWQSALSDLRYRYAGTGMGIFWNLIHPGLEIFIYTVIFSILYPIQIQGVSYVIYLCAGLLPWRAFADGMMQGSNALAQNAIYMRRLAIPSEVFIAKSVLMATFILYLYLALLLPITFAFGKPLGWQALFLPILVLPLQLLAFGIALILAPLRILIPDTLQIFQALLPIWSWTLPIVYPETVFDPSVRAWLYFNPPFVFIQSIRNLIVNQQFPSISMWMIMVAWVFLILILGNWVSRNLKSEVKDMI